ncbi:MAG TPA: TIR domain-containing protein [Pyrinomonadaceae bacterium]|nr:TIR domain-containing protein [Pyrinomonadaceae bacterium]
MTQVLELAQPLMKFSEPTALPHLTTPGDVKELVKYLKRKPGGVTIAEGMDAVKKRLFDPRKVLAYEMWGIVSRDGDLLRLSLRGWELARQLEPLTGTFRGILSGCELYNSVLSWVLVRELDVITDYEVTAYWRENFADALGESDEVTLRSCAICFFNLCQEAALGVTTIGTRGQPARFRVYQEELSEHLESGVSTGAGDGFEAEAFLNIAPENNVRAIRPLTASSKLNLHPVRMRVLLSCGSKTEIIEQICSVLEAADVECLLVERRRETDAASDERLSAMRRCDAALVLVTGEECITDENGSFAPQDSVLMEVGAARALYGNRVALLWDGRFPIAYGLSGIVRREFTPDVLTWQTGIDILGLIKLFKDSSPGKPGAIE